MNAELPTRRTPPPQRLALAVAWLALSCGPGCTSFLAGAIATAPNRARPFVEHVNLYAPLERLAGVNERFRVAVGPPRASLVVNVVEPDANLWPRPRATILVLHGMQLRGYWMLDTADRLTDAGYRAVVVDLRGQGGSSGEWLTYGIQEARDLSQVIDELQRRQLIVGGLGVYGVSYGATTGIHLAAVDSRVQSVVAVAPFSSMRREVSDYLRTVLPGVGAAISDETIQAAVDRAGDNAGFNPDAADAAIAIRRAHAAVLLVHGTDDKLVPPQHSLRLHIAAPLHSHLELLPGEGHVSVWRDKQGLVAALALDWFVQVCPTDARPAAARDPSCAANCWAILCAA